MELRRASSLTSCVFWRFLRTTEMEGTGRSGVREFEVRYRVWELLLWFVKDCCRMFEI